MPAPGRYLAEDALRLCADRFRRGEVEHDPTHVGLVNDAARSRLEGDGTFDAAVGYDAGESPIMTAPADLDGFSGPDLAVTNKAGISVLLGLCPAELPCPPCDLDGDGVVGILDFLALLAAWGPCVDCDDCPGDIDGDCMVGIVDFLTLLANWG